MSLREDISEIKNELTAQEKFLESIIKLEGFYKKNRKILVGVIVVLVVVGIGVVIKNSIEEQKIINSNIAYMTLKDKPEDKEALETLAKNESLYNVYLFEEALKSGNIDKLNELANKNIPILSDIAKYQMVSLKKDEKLFAEYSTKQGAILKDLATLQEVYLLIQNGNLVRAKEKLSFIGFDSPVRNIATFMEHYLIDSKKN